MHIQACVVKFVRHKPKVTLKSQVKWETGVAVGNPLAGGGWCLVDSQGKVVEPYRYEYVPNEGSFTVDIQ